MITKRLIAVFAAVMMLVCLFSACSNGASSSSGSASSSTSAADTKTDDRKTDEGKTDEKTDDALHLQEYIDAQQGRVDRFMNAMGLK